MSHRTPAGAPAPEAAGRSLSRHALSPPAAAMLAYAGWWVTGGLMLMADPSRPFVRFHAWQAFAGLGLIWLLGALLWTAGFLAVFVSPTAFRVLVIASQTVWLAGVVAWIVGLIQAFRGQTWSMPLLGGWISSLGVRLGALRSPPVLD